MAKEDEALKAELAETKAKLERAQADLDAAKAKAVATPSVEAHKQDTRGTRRYVVLGARVYVRGSLYRQGDVVTLQDGEVPSRSWRKLKDGETPTPTASPAVNALVEPLQKSKTPAL